MADTLETIYLNENLGATQFDADQEETILTTDANTRYVIKDMIVKDTSSLGANSYLELNGFRVADLTSNATGSLIVGPNSTLKIKSDKYPFSYVTREVATVASDNKGYYEKTVSFSDGSASSTLVSAGSPTNPSILNPTTVIDFAYIDKGVYKYFHTAAHDSNSGQYLNWNRFGESPDAGQNIARSYVAVGLSQDTSRGYIGIMSTGSTFQAFNLDTNPADASITTIGTFSPAPTSSYPRSTVAYGYIWFIPSNSYTSAVYAMNIETGITTSLSFLSAKNTAGSTFIHMGVTLDPVTDKFLIWRPNTASSLEVRILDVTKTELDARTSNSSVSSTVLKSEALAKAINTNYFASGVFSPQADGTIGYKTSSNEFIVIDTNFDEVQEGFSLSSVTVAGQTVSAADRFYTSKQLTATAADIAASGLIPPVFGVQLLGVKSEGV